MYAAYENQQKYNSQHTLVGPHSRAEGDEWLDFVVDGRVGFYDEYQGKCPKVQKENTGLFYKVRHHLKCKSRYVVYLIKCNQSGEQYVGRNTNHQHTRTGQRN